MTKKKPKQEYEERLVFDKMEWPNLVFAVMYFIVGFAFVISAAYALNRLEMNIIFFIALFFVCVKEGVGLLIKSAHTALRAWKIKWVVKEKGR
jgi:hypothetical protein